MELINALRHFSFNLHQSTSILPPSTMVHLYKGLTQLLPSWFALICLSSASPQAFHFNRFSGPVSGPISRVEVPGNQNGAHGVDFVAKPDYSFAYGVEDPISGNYQNQKEVRDGDVVKGEYSIVDPDGTTRRVTYTADPKNGFQATVHLSEPNHEHASKQQQFVNSLQNNPNYIQSQQQHQHQHQQHQQQHHQPQQLHHLQHHHHHPNSQYVNNQIHNNRNGEFEDDY